MMTNKALLIKSVSRRPETDPSDTLYFDRGVNVIIGNPNTGKSQWMRMIDYLMGDTDKPSDAFDPYLTEKYDSISGVFEIDGKEFTLERRWKERGRQGTVYVNGLPVRDEDFSDVLLNELGIPLVNYPAGNPYSPGAWRRLTWRNLLRQIYRKQSSWADIAAKQPESEQHACLMLFLGLAEVLFSPEYGALVKLQQQMASIAAKKEQFLSMLNELSSELLSHAEAGLEITSDSIFVATQALNKEETELQEKRDTIIKMVASAAEQEVGTGDVERLSAKYEEFQELRASLLESESENRQRLAELDEYKGKLDDEIAKFERARSAGNAFEGLRVTHCPACQRKVAPKELPNGECYVCHQTGPQEPREAETSRQRLEFEFEQLNGEADEAADLIDAVTAKLNSLKREILRVDEELGRLQQELRPIRRAVAAVLPPEVSIIDKELGRLQERRSQLERVRVSLMSREKLSEQIEAMEKQAGKLDAEVQYQRLRIDFTDAAEALETGMNQYLRELTQAGRRLWVSALLEKRVISLVAA